MTKRESCRGCILSMGVTIETPRAKKCRGGGGGGGGRGAELLRITKCPYYNFIVTQYHHNVNYLYISAQEKIAIKAALSEFFRNTLRENFLGEHAPRFP